MTLVKKLKQTVKDSLAILEFESDKLKLAFSPPPPVDPWLTEAKNKHKGERCFVIATGPSLNSLDLSYLKGEVCFGVNGTYLLENVNLEYFVYVSNWWHKQHIEGIKKVRCKRRFLPQEFRADLESDVSTTWFRKLGVKYFSKWQTPLPVPAGFSFKPDRYIYPGGTVVCVCLQLAYYFGFSEVYIIGLDHSYSKAKDEEFKKHGGSSLKMDSNDTSHFTPSYINTSVDARIDLQAMERGYSLAKKAFEQDGRKIYNASATTQLEIFDRVEYNNLFDVRHDHCTP